MGGVGVGGRKRIYAKKKAGYVLHEGGATNSLGRNVSGALLLGGSLEAPQRRPSC